MHTQPCDATWKMTIAMMWELMLTSSDTQNIHKFGIVRASTRRILERHTIASVILGTRNEKLSRKRSYTIGIVIIVDRSKEIWYWPESAFHSAAVSGYWSSVCKNDGGNWDKLKKTTIIAMMRIIRGEKDWKKPHLFPSSKGLHVTFWQAWHGMSDDSYGKWWYPSKGNHTTPRPGFYTVFSIYDCRWCRDSLSW